MRVSLEFIGFLFLIVSFMISASVHASDVVFDETFDDQPDWTSGMYSANKVYYAPKDIIPDNWHIVRAFPEWAPTTGYPNHHETIEILASNTDKTRSGAGKSFVKWRDSRSMPDGNWNSDGFMLYRLPEDGLAEVYVEFWITFSDEMIATYYNTGIGGSKLLRIISHDFPDEVDRNDYYQFFGSDSKPMYIWDIGGNTTYGTRNAISILREKTSPTDLGKNVTGMPLIQGYPMNFQRGGVSIAYSANGTRGQDVGGADPQLTDYKNGGVINKGPVALDQLFGDEKQWVKIGQYVKLNSSPGVPDGELKQFINDKRVLNLGGIEWLTSANSPSKKFNLVGIGGNDAFAMYPDEDHYEDWYAIDDLKIYDGLPDRLKTGYVPPPMPPGSVRAD